jgi:hypothetical protein
MAAMDPSMPVPVIPLPYQGDSDDPLRSLLAITKGVSWLIVFRSALGLAEYAFVVWCYACQRSAPTAALRQLIAGPPLVMDLPAAAVEIVALAGGIGCLRLRERGRVWVVRTAAAEAAIGPVTALSGGIYYQVSRGYLRYGLPFAAQAFAPHAAAVVYEPVVAAAIWLFFRQRSVRQTFRPG